MSKIKCMGDFAWNRSLMILIGLTMTLCPASPLVADGWSPFSDSKTKTINTSSNKSSWPSLSMPKWPKSMTPSFMKKSSAKKKGPSTMTKMSRATKSWWNKTAELLDPYPDETPKSSAFSESKESKKPSGSWMGGLWNTNKKEKRDETIGDFLNRPMLQ